MEGVRIRHRKAEVGSKVLSDDGILRTLIEGEEKDDQEGEDKEEPIALPALQECLLLL
jgi:hypothetical protein